MSPWGPPRHPPSLHRAIPAVAVRAGRSRSVHHAINDQWRWQSKGIAKSPKRKMSDREHRCVVREEDAKTRGIATQTYLRVPAYTGLRRRSCSRKKPPNVHVPWVKIAAARSGKKNRLIPVHSAPRKIYHACLDARKHAEKSQHCKRGRDAVDGNSRPWRPPLGESTHQKRRETHPNQVSKHNARHADAVML